MGNIYSCLTNHKSCALCRERFTEDYIMCAVCNKTIHDECEYIHNRRYYTDCCPMCRKVNPIYYKFSS